MKTPHLFFLTGCLFVTTLQAQWTADPALNTLVSTAIAGDMHAAATADGRTYVAYWHDVPAPQYYEMRLQLLDADGNRQFGDEGLLVNGTVPMSSFTTTWSLAVDDENNAYVGFNGTDGGNPVFVHKIAPDGTVLWSINPGSGFDVKILPLASGEAIIAWLPGNQGVLQKVGTDGAALWPAPVTIQPGVANHRSSAGEMAELADGSFVVVLHDRGGFSPSSLPYAQRYHGTTGASVWPTPVALTTTYYTAFNRRYTLRQDADTLYFGYAGAQGLQPVGFVQRIDPDGALPWGVNGSDFSMQNAAYEQDVRIAYTPGSPYVWAVGEYSDAAQGMLGIYVQKFDKVSGARLLTDLGREVFPISDAYISQEGDLQLVHDQPVFLVSDGNSNGVFPKDLLVVYLDQNGDFAWPEHTRPVATNANGVKSRVQLTAAHDDRLVAAWTEDRTGASLPYAQRIDSLTTSTSVVDVGNVLSGVRAAPNPASGSVLLTLELREAGSVFCALRTATGGTVSNWTLELGSGVQQIPVSVARLSPGCYDLVVQTKRERRVLKVVVQ